MKRTLFIFALFVSLGLTANDSLRTREKKWILTVNGNAALFNQPVFSRSQKYSITKWYGARFKGMYLIPGTPKKNLAAGINGSFSSFLFNDVLMPPGLQDPSSGYGTTFFYDPEMVSIRNYNGNIGMFFSLYGMYEGLYFSHDLGICFTFFAKNEGDIKYKEITVTSGTGYSQDSIKPGNPSGYYNYKTISTVEFKERYTFYNSVVPFYNLEFGVAIGNMAPFFGMEIMYHKYYYKVESDRFHQPFTRNNKVIFKANLGVAIRF